MPTKKLLVVYDSITGNTERMAKFIAEGAQKKLKDVIVKKIDEVTEQELIDADIIAFGCPTYNRTLTSTMKKFFETKVVLVKDHLKGKFGAAFGAYGWSGDTLEIMRKNMKYLKVKVIDLPQDFTGGPDEDFYITSLSEIKEKSLKFGEDLAKKVRATKK